MTLHDWSAMPLEVLSPTVSRRMVHSERMTIARLFLKAGATVPEHHHENEQFSMIMQGSLKFFIEGKELVVSAGQALQIPPGVPHSAEAFEDCEALDIFAPCREDWKRGEDSYLRGGQSR